MIRGLLVLVLLWLPIFPTIAADESPGHLEKIHTNINDKASLQRGARIYLNYCSGCHAMRYMRYDRLAMDLGIVDKKGRILKDIVQRDLIFTGAKITDPIDTAMKPSDAKQWFGIVPPDLTLEARVRGVDWIYAYLHNFYSQPDKTWGVNNVIFPDVAMPNVMLNLQGEQRAVYHKITGKYEGTTQTLKEVDHLYLLESSKMSPAEYDQTIYDLVNFLAYAAEPERINREQIGTWVLFFVILFAICTYLLKREFWKDVHSG